MKRIRTKANALNQDMSEDNGTFDIRPIGLIRTPFSQKFGIPRQSSALSIAKGHIEFCNAIEPELACEGLLQFSHCWLLFQFHQHADKEWQQRVRPPRLGGNEKRGVFATRSSFRPNNIGMSVVKLLSLEKGVLSVEGVDLLDKTPIIDIKPYIAYSDALVDAQSSYAQSPPEALLKVDYSEEAQTSLEQISQRHPDIRVLADKVISHDPRPAYKARQSDDKHYSLCLYGFDFCFSVANKCAHVHKIAKYTDK